MGSSGGGTAVLPATMVARLELGAARFDHVPALIYDCSAISEQKGVKIDGILGFPLFRETLLTLDYSHGTIVLRRNPPTIPGDPIPALPGSTIDFSLPNKTPLIPLRLDNRTFIALVDSGSDDALSLNPRGLTPPPRFLSGPTEGLTVGTLKGDQVEEIGRLADTLSIGDYAVPRPVVEMSGDTWSALGGGILKYFTITFDQEHDRVTFFRDATNPIAVPGIRSTGLSFAKTPAYWRVVGVVPGSPADAEEVEPGDLVTRINGEPVAKWDTHRYDQLIAQADSVVITFLYGTQEKDMAMRVKDLVP